MIKCQQPQAHPARCGCEPEAPVGYVSGERFAAEHERLRECRAERAQLRADVAILRQHKTDYMEAAEGTRRALLSELQALKSAGSEVPEVVAIVDESDDGKFAEVIDVPGIGCTVKMGDKLMTVAQCERIVAAFKAQLAGHSPAGWQARFTSSGDNRDTWQPCSKEHFELVKRCPADWPGYEVREVFAAPPAAQDVSALPPFAEKVLEKLRRFEECAEDSDSGGVDIGRHWLDLMTQLALLNRVQRSPGLWEISQQGEDFLAAHRKAQQQEQQP